MKRILPLIVLIMAVFSAGTFAQLEIGASYELREETPQNGFGLRIEKGILQQLPILDLSLRLHGSYFSEENSISPTNQSYTYSQDLTNYDVGIAAIGGISLGLLQPYVGLGIGTENYEQAITDVQSDPNNLAPANADESSLYWNVLAGAKVTVLPLIKPFVEYRYSMSELEKPDLQGVESSTGRIMFGVSLSF